jgi:hypothetical protein
MSSSKLIKIVFLVVVIGCVSDRVSPESDFLITGNSIGRVKLGQRKEEVVASYQNRQVKEVDLLLEGMPAPAVQVYDQGALLLTAEIDLDKGTVYRISTNNERFRTEDNIGVGSTLGAVKSKYGAPESVARGEGELYAIFKFQTGVLSVALDADFPKESSKVINVLIVSR